MDAIGKYGISVRGSFLLGIFQQFSQVLFQFGECFDFDYVKFGLNSGFVRESDFFEFVDEVVEFASFCSFRNFLGILIN